ncbi:MAG: histidine phosphatase family protein [Chloroflexi bacterium]|nr:histidine phosphatase family protein [Chloroflexota bacterium]
MENKLYLLRHGENPANLSKEFSCRKVDYPLTAKGRLQAQQTGEYFQRLGVDEIYTSPLKRAAETAEIIAARLGLSCVILEDLRELDVGDLEDTHGSAEGWRVHNGVLRAWIGGALETRFPSGEDYYQAEARMRRAVAHILGEKDGRRILICGHGGLFTTTIKDLCPTVDFQAVWRAETQNCAVSELAMQRQNGRWQGDLLRWADTSHLSGEAAELVSGVHIP